jgi:hypothetical protein
MCLRAHISFKTLNQTVTLTAPQDVRRFGCWSSSLVIGHWSLAVLVVRQCGRKKRDRLGPMLAACTILHHEYLRLNLAP